jgi:hypothetical protein
MSLRGGTTWQPRRLHIERDEVATLSLAITRHKKAGNLLPALK